MIYCRGYCWNSFGHKPFQSTSTLSWFNLYVWGVQRDKYANYTWSFPGRIYMCVCYITKELSCSHRFTSWLKFYWMMFTKQLNWAWQPHPPPHGVLAFNTGQLSVMASNPHLWYLWKKCLIQHLLLALVIFVLKQCNISLP